MAYYWLPYHGSTPTKCSKIKAWFRWLFRCCIDCGIKLDKSYSRGDVCCKCFNEFNGIALEELIDDRVF